MLYREHCKIKHSKVILGEMIFSQKLQMLSKQQQDRVGLSLNDHWDYHRYKERAVTQKLFLVTRNETACNCPSMQIQLLLQLFLKL